LTFRDISNVIWFNVSSLIESKFDIRLSYRPPVCRINYYYPLNTRLLHSLRHSCFW